MTGQPAPRSIQARVDTWTRLSTRTALLRLAPGRPFPFRAGQYVRAGLAVQPDRRPYSIATSPGRVRASGLIELLVGLSDTGSAGPHLETLSRGSVVTVEGPSGTFGLPRALRGRHLLFVAGGTGIAPLRSMLLDAASRPVRPSMDVVYSARMPDELSFHEELVALAQAGATGYHPTVTRDAGPAWTGRRGRIDAAMLAPLAHPHSVCLVCGSSAFNDAVRVLLGGLGVPMRRVRTEY